jgi:hypothetical protein
MALSDGHVKSERCKDQLSVRVVAVAQNAAKTSLNVARQLPLEVGVGSYDLRNLSHHGREVLEPVEDEQRRLGIAPCRIPQQLVNRLRQRLLTLPELTLTDEDVSIPNPDQDVSLAFVIEGLSGWLGLRSDRSAELKTENAGPLVFRGLCSERERLTRVVLGKVPAAAMG